ncbi:hypothetical protein RND81_12G203600 [Saponaria officinalis]|uniref:CCHC-type domain-containing protein n=1 Tax=Saponaria officinalis TaxID=3572 RepID=A0AAW1HD81_SAPOF
MVDPFDVVPDIDYLRLRVCVALNEPLNPGFFLACEDGLLLWIQFRYEEVFKYCVRCGKIGHKAINCTEKAEKVLESINHSLQRISDNGFPIFQTDTVHSMFNLDLRALPSTTKFTTSRIKLGHNRGLSAPADFDEERVIDFDLGTTPGGKVHPGMRFVVSAQPFTGPILFPQGYQDMHPNHAQDENHHEGPMDDNMEATRAEGNADNANNVGINQTASDNNMDTAGSEGNIQRDSNRGGEETDQINAMEGETGLGFSVTNHMLGVSGHGEQEYTYNYDFNVQEAIRIRIEENLCICKQVDDQRGYNQCFYPPVENANGNGTGEFAAHPVPANQRNGCGGWLEKSSSEDSMYSTPEWPSMGFSSNVASDDHESSTPIFEDAIEDHEGNSIIVVGGGENLGVQKDENRASDGDIKEGTHVGELMTGTISAAGATGDQGDCDAKTRMICLRPDMLLEGAMDVGDTALVDTSLGKVAPSASVPKGMEISPAQMPTDKTDLMLLQSGKIESLKQMIMPIKKRKAVSDPTCAITPDHALESKENALNYLRGLNKRGRFEEANHKKGGTFRMYVGTEDFDSYEGFIDDPSGVAGVDPKQPPLHK